MNADDEWEKYTQEAIADGNPGTHAPVNTTVGPLSPSAVAATGLSNSQTMPKAASTGDLKSKGRSAEEIKDEIRKRVEKTVRKAAGPSFEERIAAAARKMQKQAADIEREQKEFIAAAIERGRGRETSAPIRPLEPESVDDRAARGMQEVNKHARGYWQDVKALKEKMANREPLYKLDEVQAAFEELQARQAARKKELTQEERFRWKMIRGLQEKVLERPLAMESFKKKAISATELRRMANPPAEPFGVDKKIEAAVKKKSFTESQWYTQVQDIKKRQDDRVPLHEQTYPPYVRPEITVPPRVLGPIEKQIETTVNTQWFKNSQWTQAVQEMKEKQSNREKLHEISYPKKWEDPPPVNPPSAFILKIQAQMEEKVEANRLKMLAEERKQRSILRQIKAEGLQKRDRGAIGLRP